MTTRRTASSQLAAPLGSAKPAKNENVGYPAYVDPDTGKPSIMPYEDYSLLPGGFKYMKERAGSFIAAFLKETICTAVVCLAVLAVLRVPIADTSSAAVATFEEIFLRAIALACAFGGTVAIGYRLGHAPGLPRHLNLAVTTYEAISFHIHWFGALVLYVVPGVVGSMIAASVVMVLPGSDTHALTPQLFCAYNASTCPFAVSNPVFLAGAVAIVLFMSALVALLIGHFDTYHELEKLRNNGKNRSYRTTLRAIVGGMANFGVQLLSYLLWGQFGFDSWTYFAGAFANLWAGFPWPFAQHSAWEGVGALFILVPILGGLVAYGLDWLMVGLERAEIGKDKYDVPTPVNNEVTVRSNTGITQPLLQQQASVKSPITNSW